MDSVSSNNLGANNLSSTDYCNPPVADKIKTLLNDRGKAFEVHLQERLRSSKTDSDGNLAKTEVPYYMYFDEAHVLTHVDSNTPPRLAANIICSDAYWQGWNNGHSLPSSFRQILGWEHSHHPYTNFNLSVIGTTSSCTLLLQNFHSIPSPMTPLAAYPK